MKTRNRLKAVKAKSPRPNNIPDFDHLAEVAEAQVEHQTILEFLRLIPHKWHPDEIGRFGDKVRRMADSLQLPFVPSLNPSLGVIRTFPVPLLQWIYTLLATQFGWPAPALALDDGKREQREELRRHEGARKHLEGAVEHAPTPAVSDALAIVLNWLEGETKRLRGEVEPLKAV
jgi:hypothetical protein